ncbi:MAG: DUF2470 domain-containing protein [Bacteroidota bacterium]
MNEQKPIDQKFAAYAISHVNEDHRPEMIDILRKICKADWVLDAELLSFDHHKMVVEGTDQKAKTERFEISFDRPLQNAKEFRPVLIEIVKKARQT